MPTGDAQPQPFRAPDETRAGPYRLAQQIGSCPVAETFVGELVDAVQGPRRVCIKRIPRGHDDELQAFLAEAATIVDLEHPEVVRLHYFGRTDRGCYLAFDLVDGVDLAVPLRRGAPLSPGLTVYIATRVATALAAIHQGGLVHRDVSPGNILMTSRGEVLLADLGVARARGLDHPIRWNMAARKPPYTAPELGLYNQVDPVADLYGLGAVMYACLTGQPPHGGISAQETLQQAAAGQHRALQSQAPRAPVELVELVEALLAPSPAARPADAARVLERLRSLDVPRDAADELRALVQQRPAAHAVPGPPAQPGPAESTPKPSASVHRRHPRAGREDGMTGPLIWLGTAALLAILGWLFTRLMQ